MSDKKKFRDTKFGSFLINKVPKAAGLIGDLLPDSGVFGIAKNIIGAAAKDGDIDQKTADQLYKELEHEHQMYEIEVQDRASARDREVGMAKAGRSDWMMNVSGVFALIATVGIVYVVLFAEVSDKELFYFVAGAVFTYCGQVMSYYFGSSKGSKDKDKLIK